MLLLLLCVVRMLLRSLRKKRKKKRKETRRKVGVAEAYFYPQVFLIPKAAQVQYFCNQVSKVTGRNIRSFKKPKKKKKKHDWTKYSL